MLHYQCCLTWLLHNTVLVFPKLFFPDDDDDDVCKQLLITSDDNISLIFISGEKLGNAEDFWIFLRRNGS